MYFFDVRQGTCAELHGWRVEWTNPHSTQPNKRSQFFLTKDRADRFALVKTKLKMTGVNVLPCTHPLLKGELNETAHTRGNTG